DNTTVAEDSESGFQLKRAGTNLGYGLGDIIFNSDFSYRVLVPKDQEILLGRVIFDGMDFKTKGLSTGIESTYQTLHYSGVDQNDVDNRLDGAMFSTTVHLYFNHEIWGVSSRFGMGYGLTAINAVADICMGLNYCLSDPAKIKTFYLNNIFLSYNLSIELALIDFYPDNLKIGYQNLILQGSDRGGLLADDSRNSHETEYLFIIDTRILYLAFYYDF
ncbi:MAG: hypothetical protein HQ517_01330, partial [SAR324 cluster bacterium]|nr:hypothetical protein [SAR324 cluster bacterium]